MNWKGVGNIGGTVCFTGHRPNKFSLDGGFRNLDHQLIAWVKCELFCAILDAIEAGYTNFIYGGAIGVDMWAGEIVADIREFFPNITLTLYEPFAGCEGNRTAQDIQAFRRLKKRCNGVVTVCEGGYEGRKDAWKLQVRNKAMVDNSTLTIAVWDGSKGGTGNCVNYVEKVGKPYWHIDPSTRANRKEIGILPRMHLQEEFTEGLVF